MRITKVTIKCGKTNKQLYGQWTYLSLSTTHLTDLYAF